MTTCILAQLNFTVGRIDDNAQKILTCLDTIHQTHSTALVIFPELALSGYPPEDLLFRDDFLESVHQKLQFIINHMPQGITAIIGYPEKDHHQRFNSAAVITHKQIIANYRKQILPNYGVFDEKRYFQTGDQATVFDFHGKKIGVIICEDAWHNGPAEAAKKAGAEIIAVINGSPFYVNKYVSRVEKMRERVMSIQIPLMYAHHVNGQDDLIFDGASFVLNQQGELSAQAAFFEEELLTVNLNQLNKIQPEIPSSTEQCYNALVLGVREYVLKNNFKKVLLGFSGGIDSALTCAIAIDALGKDNVIPVLLPSPYTSPLSLALAQTQLKEWNVKRARTIPINTLYEQYIKLLDLDIHSHNLTTQNIQARIRGTILMAIANQENLILLNTSNKSEIAAGYGTLYGDLCGGYAVLKDVWKTDVYVLARHKKILPEIIDREPTAELAPNQFDTDSLPPYDQLDPILKNYVEHDLSIAKIVELGFDEKTVQKCVNLLKYNEYKRRQVAPGPRITRRAFTRERRYPITSG